MREVSPVRHSGHIRVSSVLQRRVPCHRGYAYFSATQVQFTTFQKASMNSGRRFWYFT